jgi:hypothetical protein
VVLEPITAAASSANAAVRTAVLASAIEVERVLPGLIQFIGEAVEAFPGAAWSTSDALGHLATNIYNSAKSYYEWTADR